MKKKITFLIFHIFIIDNVFSQSYLSVDLDNPVYIFLDAAELKGLVTGLSEVKPYTQKDIGKFLETIDKQRNKLSKRERLLLDSFLLEFNNGQTQGKSIFNLKRGELKLTGNPRFPLYLGISALSDDRVNFSTTSPSFSTHNLVDFYFKGDLGPHFSYKMDLGMSFDRLCLTDWVPYSFTPDWDGPHLSFSGGGGFIYDTALADNFNIAFKSSPEIGYSAFNDKLLLSWRKTSRNWGVGEESLIVSSSAQEFDAIEMQLRPVPWMQYSYLTGALSNGSSFLLLRSAAWNPNTDSSSVATDEKMYTIRNLEFFPLQWLYFSFGETAVWAKRFDIGYLNPFMISTFYQAFNGDTDNLGLHGTIAVKVPYAKIYFNLFMDEIGSQGVKAPDMTFFEYLKNIYSFSTGVQGVIPFLPLTMLTFQYTKIEPYCYSHYPQPTPHQTAPVNINYTHQGYNLANPLPPNSDEILVKLESLPFVGFNASLTYRLIRHGNNADGYGDIGRNWYEINSELGTKYKSFLHDGIYDWTNAVSLEAGYHFKNFPIKITLGYTFSYTFWRTNGYSISDINSFWITPELPKTLEPVMKNIIALQIHFFS